MPAPGEVYKKKGGSSIEDHFSHWSNDGSYRPKNIKIDGTNKLMHVTYMKIEGENKSCCFHKHCYYYNQGIKPTQKDHKETFLVCYFGDEIPEEDRKTANGRCKSAAAAARTYIPMNQTIKNEIDLHSAGTSDPSHIVQLIKNAHPGEFDINKSAIIQRVQRVRRQRSLMDIEQPSQDPLKNTWRLIEPHGQFILTAAICNPVAIVFASPTVLNDLNSLIASKDPPQFFYDTGFNVSKNAYISILSYQDPQFTTTMGGNHPVILTAVMLHNSKEKKTHKACFDAIASKIVQWGKQCITTDGEFEYDTMNLHTPGQHSLCHLHLLRAFYRQCQEKHFTKTEISVLENKGLKLLNAKNQQEFDALMAKERKMLNEKWALYEHHFVNKAYKAALFRTNLRNCEYPNNNPSESLISMFKRRLQHKLHNVYNIAREFLALCKEQYEERLAALCFESGTYTLSKEYAHLHDANSNRGTRIKREPSKKAKKQSAESVFPNGNPW